MTDAPNTTKAPEGGLGSTADADTHRATEGAVVEPSEAMCDAARGLIMMDRFGLPNAKTPLSECARSGFYGEHWVHVLDEEERDFAHRLPKGHLASLIWRAMESARLKATTANSVGTEKPSGFGVDHEAKSEAALWRAHDEMARRGAVDHENHEALREKVARIIDPWPFGIVPNISFTERAAVEREKAFTKADAILSALQSGEGQP